MIKMLEIRKQIYELLPLTYQVYYQRASEKAVFPYVTYDISNSMDDGTLERFMMDVDGFDNKSDTTAIETMMHEVDEALHRKTISVEKDGKELTLTIYRENRLTFDELDRRIFHRRYTYQIRTHQK